MEPRSVTGARRGDGSWRTLRHAELSARALGVDGGDESDRPLPELFVSLANVLGSNIFDLLIAVPAGVSIAGGATVDYAAAAQMMAALS